MWYAYVLRSLKDHGFYYGSTSDVNIRLKAHNTGKVRTTKSRRPLVLHYVEEYRTRKEAIPRENFFKRIDGYDWLRSEGIIAAKHSGKLAEQSR